MFKYSDDGKEVCRVIAPLPSYARLRRISSGNLRPKSKSPSHNTEQAVVLRRTMSPTCSTASSSSAANKHPPPSPPPPYEHEDRSGRTPGRQNSNGSPPPPELAHIPIRAKPIPHVVLPAPFQDFCLTSYLITDADDLHAIVNHPGVAKGLGLKSTSAVGGVGRGVGTAQPLSFTMADAVARIKGALDCKSGWPYNVIRRTRSLVSDSFPPLLGTITFSRDNFSSMPSRLRRKWRDLERDLPETEAHWTLEFCLDPAFAGRGLMTAVIRFILEQWFVKVLHPKAGSLTSTYLASNMAAARVHAKLGFRPVAIRRGRAYRQQQTAGMPMTPPISASATAASSSQGAFEELNEGGEGEEKEPGEVDPQEDLVFTVWQGSGRCGLGDSIFFGMTPWVPAMAGPGVSPDFAWINTSATFGLPPQPR